MTAPAGISVIIPTREAVAEIPLLVSRLRSQTLPPAEIIILDSSSTDGTPDLAREIGCTVETVPRDAFDHGGTRNLGARRACGDILVFLTQDALPATETFLETLIRPLSQGHAAAYARQAASPDARPTEVFARLFNYPGVSRQQSLSDLPHLGIRTFFMSDAASAVARAPLEAVGGFPERVIMSEDMLLCARLLRRGYTVAYEASAVVQHSHSLTLRQTLQRYFDIGVMRVQAGDLLAGARWHGQGLRFGREMFAYLVRSGAWTSLPRAGAEVLMKAVGVQLGRRHRCIPVAIKRRLSRHAGFWSAVEHRS
jgi:rhamnosyltransferase